MSGGHFMKYVDKRKIQKIEDFRQLVFSAADRFGDRILYASPKKDGYRFTYSDFKRDIISFGTALIERGIKDQKIAVMGEAHPAYMTAYYGTTISGNVIVPLDKELQIKEVVNNVVFPAIYMILALFFFVKLGTAYFDYRKTGQFEWTGPAILFACLVFTLTAPTYVWTIIGV